MGRRVAQSPSVGAARPAPGRRARRAGRARRMRSATHAMGALLRWILRWDPERSRDPTPHMVKGSRYIDTVVDAPVMQLGGPMH